MEHFPHSISRTNRAFTLVEAIIAIGILTLVIAGATPVVLRALSMTDDAQNRMIATFLAQEGIELVRRQRDTFGIQTFADPSNPVRFDTQHGSGDLGVGFFSTCFTTACKFDATTDESSACGAAVGGPCTDKLKLNGNGRYQYDSGSDTIFTRTIRIERYDYADHGTLQDTTVPTRGSPTVPGSDSRDDTLRVTSEVTYTTRFGIDMSVTLETFLLDLWRLDYN